MDTEEKNVVESATADGARSSGSGAEEDGVKVVVGGESGAEADGGKVATDAEADGDGEKVAVGGGSGAEADGKMVVDDGKSGAEADGEKPAMSMEEICSEKTKRSLLEAEAMRFGIRDANKITTKAALSAALIEARWAMQVELLRIGAADEEAAAAAVSARAIAEAQAETTALRIQLNSVGAAAVPTVDVEAVIGRISQDVDAAAAAAMLKSTPVTLQPNLLAILFFKEPQEALVCVLKALGLPRWNSLAELEASEGVRGGDGSDEALAASEGLMPPPQPAQPALWATAAAEEDADRAAYAITVHTVRPLELLAKLDLVLSNDPLKASSQIEQAARIMGWPMGEPGQCLSLMALSLWQQKLSSVASEIRIRLKGEPGIIEFASDLVLKNFLMDNPAGIQSLRMLQARDAQAMAFVLSMARAAGDEVLCTDLANIVPGLFGLKSSAILELVAQALLSPSTKDGDVVVQRLLGMNADWSVASPRRTIKEASQFVERSLKALLRMRYAHNHKKTPLLRRVLFERAIGRNATADRLNSTYDSYVLMGYSADELVSKLSELASELAPSEQADLSAGSKSLKSGSGSKPAEVLKLEAKARDLEAKLSALSASSKSGPTRPPPIRAAAASVLAAPAAVSSRAAAGSAQAAGRDTSSDPPVQFVAGKSGQPVLEWMQCWNCNAFGHGKSDCPKKRVSGASPPSPAAKNGSAPFDQTSTGESSR